MHWLRELKRPRVPASGKARSLSRGSIQKTGSTAFSSDVCVSSLFLTSPFRAPSGSTHTATSVDRAYFFPKDFSQRGCLGHMPISDGAWGYGTSDRQGTGYMSPTHSRRREVGPTQIAHPAADWALLLPPRYNLQTHVLML